MPRALTSQEHEVNKKGPGFPGPLRADRIVLLV
jgi:hypothetical protein